MKKYNINQEIPVPPPMPEDTGNPVEHMLSSIDYQPEFGISDSRFSCYARFPIGAYYICPPNNMDGKMQGL